MYTIQKFKNFKNNNIKWNKILEAKSGDAVILIRTQKPFFIGAVNILDGYIEEVHSFETASKHDFHHSSYFSDGVLDKQDDDIRIFWFEDGYPYNWEEDIPSNIKEAIMSQVELI